MHRTITFRGRNIVAMYTYNRYILFACNYNLAVQGVLKGFYVNCEVSKVKILFSPALLLKELSNDVPT